MITGRKFLSFLCTVWCSNLILTAEAKSYLLFDRRQMKNITGVLEKVSKIFKHFRAQNVYATPIFSEFSSSPTPPWASKKIRGQMFSKTPQNIFWLYFKKLLIPTVPWAFKIPVLNIFEISWNFFKKSPKLLRWVDTYQRPLKELIITS